MRTLCTTSTVLLAALGICLCPPADAKRSVGLGVGAGVAVPSIKDVKIDPAFAWGFYTDIPLISTFHITPSTLVYRLEPKDGKGQSATDVSLNFKFVIPLGPLDLFAGVTAGVTSTEQLDPHVGALAGASINLVSNLDVFANVGYRLILGDETPNIHDVQIFVGPLFRFDY